MRTNRPANPKTPRPAKPASGGPSRTVADIREATIREVVGMIQDARGRALQAINTELVELLLAGRRFHLADGHAEGQGRRFFFHLRLVAKPEHGRVSRDLGVGSQPAF